MHITQVTLDGVTNGIAAYIRSRNNWIKRSDGKGYLFSNFDTLEARLFREPDLEYHDIQFFFVIVDKITGKSQISLNEAIATDNGWKVTRWEKIMNQNYLHIYDITSVASYQVTNVGYITTKSTGTHDPNRDPKFEYQKLKDLRTKINTAVEKMSVYQCYSMSVKKNKFGIDIKIDNTTAHIHIWTVAKLMDYNTAINKLRDDNTFELRCLPFMKDKEKYDKYGTLYIFVTCEESDSQCNYTRTKADQLEESLLAFLQDLYPDDNFDYAPCSYVGKILLTKEVDWYGSNSKNGT